jgi:hypothetical protein
LHSTALGAGILVALVCASGFALAQGVGPSTAAAAAPSVGSSAVPTAPTSPGVVGSGAAPTTPQGGYPTPVLSTGPMYGAAPVVLPPEPEPPRKKRFAPPLGVIGSVMTAAGLVATIAAPIALITGIRDCKEAWGDEQACNDQQDSLGKSVLITEIVATGVMIVGIPCIVVGFMEVTPEPESPWPAPSAALRLSPGGIELAGSF